jgi:hypothetical protein
MVAQKYDPLWELVGQKVPLQGTVVCVDSRCPNCHVIVHVGAELAPGDKVECGLCGEPLRITGDGRGVELDDEL